jgi:hypothetical protein
MRDAHLGRDLLQAQRPRPVGYEAALGGVEDLAASLIGGTSAAQRVG